MKRKVWNKRALVALAVLAGCAEQPQDSNSVARRLRPVAVGSTAPAQAPDLTDAASDVLTTALALPSDLIDANSGYESSEGNAPIARTSRIVSLEWESPCGNSGTAAAAGSRERILDETSFQTTANASLTFDQCVSYNSEYAFDGSLSYIRSYSIATGVRLAQTSLNGSLSSFYQGTNLCSVTYDNYSISRNADLATGEFDAVVNGSVTAFCSAAASSEESETTASPSATSTNVTIACVFDQAVVAEGATGISIEGDCEIVES